MVIVADDKIPFLQGVFEPFAEVRYVRGDEIQKSHLKDADVLLTRSVTNCDAGLLEGTPVKIIASATIGDDHIDKKFCSQNNITWKTAKGCNALAVVQYFTASLLALAEINDIDLNGMNIGIVGAGDIGKSVADVCHSLNMNVFLNDPPRQRKEGKAGFSGLEEIRQVADIITLHVPLNPEGEDKTYHLVDRHFIDRLSKPVILINTARGPVVESEALKDAIQNCRITYSVLDVWEGEPNIDHELLQMVTIATPHIAGYSVEGKLKATEMTVNAVADFFNLPLKNRKPNSLSETQELFIECGGLTNQQVLQQVFKAVFDLKSEDLKLRNNPSSFETIRGSYKFRRENQGFVLHLRDAGSSITEIFKRLGFKIGK
jgi:erythronate-4-phosphate dehydrogenase